MPPPQGLIKGLLTIIVPYQSPNQAGYFGGGGWAPLDFHDITTFFTLYTPEN